MNFCTPFRSLRKNENIEKDRTGVIENKLLLLLFVVIYAKKTAQSNDVSRIRICDKFEFCVFRLLMGGLEDFS